MDSDYHGSEEAKRRHERASTAFDYGNLSKLKIFKERHPAVMKDFIKKFDWEHQLYPHLMTYQKHKHDRFKYKVLSFVEQNLLGGNQIANSKNYNLLSRKQ